MKENNINYNLSITESDETLLCHIQANLKLNPSLIESNMLDKLKELFFYYIFELNKTGLDITRILIVQKDESIDSIQNDLCVLMNDSKIINYLLLDGIKNKVGDCYE